MRSLTSWRFRLSLLVALFLLLTLVQTRAHVVDEDDAESDEQDSSSEVQLTKLVLAATGSTV